MSSPGSSLSSILGRLRANEHRQEWLLTRMHVLKATASQPDAESALAAACAALRERCCGQGAVALLSTSSSAAESGGPATEAPHGPSSGCGSSGGNDGVTGHQSDWSGRATAWNAPAVALFEASADSEGTVDRLHRLLCTTAQPEARLSFGSSMSAGSSTAGSPRSAPETVSGGEDGGAAACRGDGGGPRTPAGDAAATSRAFLEQQARQGQLQMVRSEDVEGGMAAFADWRAASRWSKGGQRGSGDPPPQRMRATSCMLAVPGEDSATFCMIVQAQDGCVLIHAWRGRAACCPPHCTPHHKLLSLRSTTRRVRVLSAPGPSWTRRSS